MDDLEENDLNTLMYSKKASELTGDDLDAIIEMVREYRQRKASGGARKSRARKTADTMDKALLDTIFGPSTKPAPQSVKAPAPRR